LLLIIGVIALLTRFKARGIGGRGCSRPRGLNSGWRRISSLLAPLVLSLLAGLLPSLLTLFEALLWLEALLWRISSLLAPLVLSLFAAFLPPFLPPFLTLLLTLLTLFEALLWGGRGRCPGPPHIRPRPRSGLPFPALAKVTPC